jgi:hypothetical protein
MAGQLVGTVNDWPVTIHALGDTLRVELPSARVAWQLRKCWPQVLRLTAIARHRDALRLTVSTPRLPGVELHPNPPWYVRLMLPG